MKTSSRTRSRRTSVGARSLVVGLLLAAGTALAGCGSGSDAEAPTAHPGITAVFDEIYDDDFTANNTAAPYDKFDIVYVAFAHIDPKTHRLDFETKVGKQIELERLEALKAKTAARRAEGALKLVISLGWGDQETTADGTPLIEAYIDTVAPSIRQFVEQHDLDGFDIDYEVPQFTSAQKFKEVAQKVRRALGPDYLFTITANNTKNLDGPTLEQHFDYVNVQSYDAKGDEAFSVDDVLDLGVPASMVLAGADIEDPNSYRRDENRVAWAINQHTTKQLGGVFIWQLKPSAQQLPGGTFKDYVNQVRDATHPSDASS